MDIYIADRQTDEILRFPQLPDQISVNSGTRFQSYEPINLGEVRIPKGENLSSISWEGILPGAGRKKASHVKEWRDPKEIISMWNKFKTEGKKLWLLVTETPINYDVYLENYDVTYAGGAGDYQYNISFVIAKNIKVYTTAESGLGKESVESRPAPSPPPTYTVKPGDSLWKIAQERLGNGARYMEIYNLNKSVIGSNPNLIYPGQVFTMP